VTARGAGQRRLAKLWPAQWRPGNEHQSQRSVCATQCARNLPLKDCSSIVAEASCALARLWKTR